MIIQTSNQLDLNRRYLSCPGHLYIYLYTYDTNMAARDEAMENSDFCHQCNGTGQLLCCDGCVNSYHISCLNPPLDPAGPPEGRWFCPSCTMKGLINVLLNGIDKIPQQDFQLPVSMSGATPDVAPNHTSKLMVVVGEFVQLKWMSNII
jgi:PHD-finger